MVQLDPQEPMALLDHPVRLDLLGLLAHLVFQELKETPQVLKVQTDFQDQKDLQEFQE